VRKLNRKIPPESVSTIGDIVEPGKLADAVASQLQVKLGEKQALLEISEAKERLEKALSLMEGEMGMMQMERKIKNRVKRQMEKSQREYYLNEQMKAIQRELGDQGEERDEVGELEEKIKTKGLSEEARTKAEAEVKKLRQMSPMSAESTVVRNYLDWLLALPWDERKEISTELDAAEKQLNDEISCADRSCVSLALLELVRPRWASQLLKLRAVTLCACHLAGFAMRVRLEVIAGLISGLCRAASSKA